MSEKLPNSDCPSEILDQQASIDPSLILAECERHGLDQDWNDEYLTGVRESNHLFDDYQKLLRKRTALTAEIKRLKEVKQQALQAAQDTPGDSRAASFRRVVQQCEENINAKKQEVRNLKKEIGATGRAYEQTRRSTMESFDTPAA